MTSVKRLLVQAASANACVYFQGEIVAGNNGTRIKEGIAVVKNIGVVCNSTWGWQHPGAFDNPQAQWQIICLDDYYLFVDFYGSNLNYTSPKGSSILLNSLQCNGSSIYWDTRAYC